MGLRLTGSILSRPYGRNTEERSHSGRKSYRLKNTVFPGGDELPTFTVICVPNRANTRKNGSCTVVGGQMETYGEPVRVPGGRFVRRLLVDETGQDVIEYALLAGSIGLVGIVAWQSIVTGIGLGYQGWDANMQAAWQPADPVTP